MNETDQPTSPGSASKPSTSVTRQQSENCSFWQHRGSEECCCALGNWSGANSPIARALRCLPFLAICFWSTVAAGCDFCGHDHSGVTFCPWEATCPAELSEYNTADDTSPPAPFYLQNNGWTSTSSGSSSLGAPVVLTWSIVPDGTSLPQGVGEPVSNSNLREAFDNLFDGGMSPGGSDLTQRTWFPLMKSAFDRWSQVAGITYNYEPSDDGQALPNFSGQIGVRGDHRIGGHFIDGDVRPSVLAYNYFPNTSDMVIDTSEVTIFGNPENSYLRFRQTMMHEIGHGLGIAHVESSDNAILMEPTLGVTFEGPQFDDILAANRLYGDIYEKGVGNQTYLNATDLGPLTVHQSILIGEDAVDQRVEMTDIDFVSIDASNDTDFYKFTLAAPLRIDLELTPLGPTYNQGPQGGSQTSFNAASLSNLTLSLFATNGTSLLAFANNTGLGQPEALLDQNLFAAGTYFVRVMGQQNAAQMYQLRITAVPEPSAIVLFLVSMAGMCGQLIRRRNS